jgi:hypothetical protein
MTGSEWAVLTGQNVLDYIPPTDIKELTWTPNREFEEGQVIIKDDKLWVANGDFTTQTSLINNNGGYIRNTIMRYSTPQKH